MEKLAFAGLVNADIGIAAVQAHIPDVAHEVASGVLRTRAAEMRADAPEGGHGLFPAHSLHRQAAQQEEPPALQQFAPEPGELRTKHRQREHFPVHLDQGPVDGVDRALDFLDLGIGEAKLPSAPGAHLRAAPGCRAVEDFWRNCRHAMLIRSISLPETIPPMLPPESMAPERPAP